MSSKKTVIINALVFDGHELHEHLSVTIENGLITAITNSPDTSNATIIDATGQTLLPGFIDAHVHLIGDIETVNSLLTQMAKAGVTTAFDMGFLPKPIRDAVKNQPGKTDIRSSGNFATATGSTHSRFPFITKENLIDTPEAGIAFVKARIAEDADYIKIIADVPGPSQEVVNVLAAEARKVGKLSIAHAARKAAFAMAQEGNVDIVTHVPIDFPLTEEEAKLMKSKGSVCVPTLIMERGVAGAGVFPGLEYSAAKESVTQLHKAGVSIVVGTDSNQSPRMGVKHGDSFHEELLLLVEAGMSNVEVLRAATSASAKAFRLQDRGTIDVGKRADLVLVSGNPVEDVTATKDVKRVWIAGSEVMLS
jgi:imidazolonepropionase-like amidohydrolase